MALRAASLPLDGADIIEFGAGTGKNTAYLATRAKSIIALDLSPAMLAKAKARALGTHVRLVQHDITLPWPAAPASADLVIGNLVLEHVAHLTPMFVEAARTLRVGGLLYVSELHPYRQWRGSGARYATADGERRVEAYIHSTAEFITAALAAGLELKIIRELGDAAAGCDFITEPRLLILVFKKPL